MEPGVFRRHFVAKRVAASGRSTRHLGFTRNFVDFLALYGAYGGDVEPDEEDKDDDDDDLDGDVEEGVDGVAQDAEDEEAVGRVQENWRARDSAAGGYHAGKAFFMLVKAFIGTGVLFLPKAFANGGIVFSTVLIILLGWLTLHCMLLLVETSRKLGGSFGDIGEKLYGAGMRRVVLASIAISQAGFCCAYYIFVAQNLRDLLMIVSNCRWIVPDWYFILLQLALYIPLSWVRRIKHFHITSLVADLFILLGLAYIFFYDLSILATRGVSHDIVWLNWNGFSLCLGTAMFAFEGICLILPIAESMKHPSHFSRLITLVMLVVGGCFLAIGATGYLTFGDSVATVVFMNMPKSSPTVLALQFLYALAILLSFPLSVYPTVRITESAVFPPALDVAGAGKRSPLVKWQKNTVRAFLVAGLAAAAFAGRQHLDRVVALVGCLACIPLSFVYPAVFHYHVAQSHWVKQKDLLVAALGVLAVVYTTYLTIVEWMQGSPDLPVDRCAARGDGGGSTW
ncbi:transmembrane amino acid transporter protein-domain-containing protein [Zopfochytrium polystomum]|nr:transmembrane amino acid transporter protein-domain-containing protein [Zopfochytrium polystomum]